MHQAFPHPNPALYRAQQWAFAVALVTMLISAPLLLLLGILANALLFVLSALCVVLLVFPVILGMSATPPLSLDEQGITLLPFWGKPVRVLWSQVQAYKPYSLLPFSDSELERKMLQGRKRYQAAQGMMLVVDGLPFVYRVVAYFAGEYPKGVFAVTNRTHAEYARLVQALDRHLPKAHA